MKKYLIPYITLTNILINCKTLKRFGTMVYWVKKYLIPNTTLTNTLTNYMTLSRMGTRVQCENKFLIPNTTSDKHVHPIYDTQMNEYKVTIGELIPNT